MQKNQVTISKGRRQGKATTLQRIMDYKDSSLLSVLGMHKIYWWVTNWKSASSPSQMHWKTNKPNSASQWREGTNSSAKRGIENFSGLLIQLYLRFLTWNILWRANTMLGSLQKYFEALSSWWYAWIHAIDVQKSQSSIKCCTGSF